MAWSEQSFRSGRGTPVAFTTRPSEVDEALPVSDGRASRLCLQSDREHEGPYTPQLTHALG